MAAGDVERQMLNALEVFQYAARFRASCFVVVLEPEIPLSCLLTDLKLLERAGIAAVLLARGGPLLEEEVQTHISRGMRLSLIKTAGRVLPEAEIDASLKSGFLPLVTIPDSEEPTDLSGLLREKGLELAKHLRARKLFLYSGVEALEVDGVRKSHLSSEEARTILDSGAALNVERAVLIDALRTNDECAAEFILLAARPGMMFREVFTHMGAGTLFTEAYPNLIRQARLSDVYDIALLMKPFSEDGAILPLTEDEVAAEVGNFYVYTVNSAVVAAAKLVDYGEAAEMGKFCTLPRFRGRGRARELAKCLIERSRELNKRYVFALSTSADMWTFFQGLGFSDAPRENLPEEWQKRYDFNRPSRAFILNLRS